MAILPSQERVPPSACFTCASARSVSFDRRSRRLRSHGLLDETVRASLNWSVDCVALRVIGLSASCQPGTSWPNVTLERLLGFATDVSKGRFQIYFALANAERTRQAFPWEEGRRESTSGWQMCLGGEEKLNSGHVAWIPQRWSYPSPFDVSSSQIGLMSY